MRRRGRGSDPIARYRAIARRHRDFANYVDAVRQASTLEANRPQSDASNFYLGSCHACERIVAGVPARVTRTVFRTASREFVDGYAKTMLLLEGPAAAAIAGGVLPPVAPPSFRPDPSAVAWRRRRLT